MKALYIGTIKIKLTNNKASKREVIEMIEEKYPLTLDDDKKLDHKSLLKIIKVANKNRINFNKIDQYRIEYEVLNYKFSSNLYSQL